MVYRVIGTMSGSSLDGLDIAFVELQEVSGSWTYHLRNAVCYEYPKEWMEKLSHATSLHAREYQLLDTAYGKYCGELINRFILENGIQYQVQLIASHFISLKKDLPVSWATAQQSLPKQALMW